MLRHATLMVVRVTLAIDAIRAFWQNVKFAARSENLTLADMLLPLRPQTGCWTMVLPVVKRNCV